MTTLAHLLLDGYGKLTEKPLNVPFSKPDVWVVVPSFNDNGPLKGVLDEVLALGYSIVVVDDGSEVPVASKVMVPGPSIARHVVNLGQGAALQTGINFALSMGAAYLVTFDADGQHSASEIGALLGPLVRGVAEVALGTRFGSGGRAIDIPRGRLIVLRIATMLCRLTTGLRITDTHNGFRAFTASAARKIRISQNRMAHASQILEQTARLRLPYVEVPVTIRYTKYSKANGQKLSNGFNVLWESIVEKLL